MCKFLLNVAIKFIVCISPVFSLNAQTMMPPCTGDPQQSTCYIKINDGKGSKYSGGFNQGKYEARGVMTSPQLGKYVGVFKAGSANGLGWHLAPNGDSYIGYFKNNQYDGEGRMVFANGTVTKEGLWEKDVLKEARKIDLDEARIKVLNIEFDDAKLDSLIVLIKLLNADFFASPTCGRILVENDFTRQDIEGCDILRGRYNNNFSMLQTAVYMQKFYLNHVLTKDICSYNGQSIINKIIPEIEKQIINTSYYHLALARCYREDMKRQIKSDINNNKEIYNKALDLYKRALNISGEFFIIVNIADTLIEAQSYVQAKEMLALIPSWSSFHKSAQNKISEIDIKIEEDRLYALKVKEIKDNEVAEKKQREVDFNTPLCIGYRNSVRLATKMCSSYSSDESIGRRFIPCHNSFMISQGYGPWASAISSSMNRKCSVYGFNPPQ